MSPVPVNLTDLRLDLAALSDVEIEAEGEKLFRTEFITRNSRSGVLTTHDGVEVKFFADRYYHAFHTSHNRAHQGFAKDKVARDRIERIRWIKPIIENRAANVECWEVPLKVPEEGLRCFPGKRAYVVWQHGYIVWLEPLRAGGFKFSTAYVLPAAEISRYTNRARKLWPKTNP